MYVMDFYTRLAMSKNLTKYFDPYVHAGFLRRYLNEKREAKPRQRVEECYRQYQTIFDDNSHKVILCEGMWDNPNHFFRLHMMLAAMPDTTECRLVGILRNPSARKQRETLESLGAKYFLYLDAHEHRREHFIGEAQKQLSAVRSHLDILELRFPLSLPAYVYYDTVVKIARHPQPSLDSPLWVTVLAEVFRNLRIYQGLFQENEIVRVVSSHPWKNEFATLCWTAISHSVPCYHVTGFCERIRIRRLQTVKDFFAPVEHSPVEEFQALSSSAREEITRYGQNYLTNRECGQGSDINVRYAFRPNRRVTTKPAAREFLGIAEGKPLAVVYAPAWFDFPHTFGMQNFTDYFDWIQLTIEYIRKNTRVNWVLKPHPCDVWYGGIRLADIVGELSPHVRLQDEGVDSLTTQVAADYIVTVHGTIAIEATARGVPVICADQSYYGDWGFTYTAQSREEYIQLLENIEDCAPPSEEQQKLAMAFAALALSPTPNDLGLLQNSCDTSERIFLYGEIASCFDEYRNNALLIEQRAIGKWMESSHPSYSAYQTISHYLKKTLTN